MKTGLSFLSERNKLILFACLTFVLALMNVTWPTGSDDTGYLLAAMDIANWRIPEELGKSVHANRIAFNAWLAIPLMIASSWFSVAIWHALFCVVLYFVLLRLIKHCGYPSPLLAFALTLCPTLLGSPTMTELPTVVLAALSISFLLRGAEAEVSEFTIRSQKVRAVSCAGVSIGLLGVLHGGNIEFVPALLFLMLLMPGLRNLKTVAIVALTACIPFLVEFTVWFAMGESPLARMAYLYSAGDRVEMNTAAEVHGSNTIQSAISYFKSWIHPRTSLGAIPIVVALTGLTVFFLKKKASDTEASAPAAAASLPPTKVALIVLATYLVVNASIRLWTQGYVFGEIPLRYFVGALPFLALVAAALFRELRSCSIPAARFGTACFASVATAIVLFSSVWDANKVLTSQPPEQKLAQVLEGESVWADDQTVGMLKVLGCNVNQLGELDEMPASPAPQRYLVSSEIEERKKKYYKIEASYDPNAKLLHQATSEGLLHSLRDALRRLVGKEAEIRSLELYEINSN